MKKNGEDYIATMKEVDESQLPEGDIRIEVAYSTLNHKDGLAITGKSPLVRRSPMIPDVDLVGAVDASSNHDYQVGYSVVLKGWGVGEAHCRTLSAQLIQKAGFTRKTAQTGAVTLIQRFGSALNLNVHFHMLFLDGVYTTTPWGKSRFHRANAPDRKELTEHHARHL